ncbi:hypothetical protein FHP25_08975 [Vineibacter terrae]|uniref:Uncharacterized protein n=1 Tax=Vineibacter terrae TaxID=2586908 RepID=A0A5C8PRL4_9HYPH|nr:hypothetical protein FHP25_08975 [Vineibacter terrae]
MQQSQYPSVELPNAAGGVRVIAGEFAGHKGPARTFTPIVMSTEAEIRRAVDDLKSGHFGKLPAG